MSELLGKTEKELVGLTPWDVYPEEVAKKIDAKGIERAEVEVIIESSNGFTPENTPLPLPSQAQTGRDHT